MTQRGDLIAGRYALRERIDGRADDVWLADDRGSGRAVAVMVYPRSDDAVLPPPAMGLSHPGIGAVLNYGRDGDGAYVVMEHMAGETLRARLDREPSGLGAAETMALVVGIARALAAAHAKGVVHRDLRPEHVMLRPEVGPALVAVGTTPGWWSGDGQAGERAAYLAPEQVNGAPITAATDIYALGVIAYTGLVGRPPFTAETAAATAELHVRAAVPSLPADLDPRVREVVTRALAKDPAARWPSANAMADAATAAAALSASPSPAMTTAPLAPTEPAPAPISAAELVAPPLSTLVSSDATPIDIVDPGPPTDFSLWVQPARRFRLPHMIAAASAVLVLAAAGFVAPALLGRNAEPGRGGPVAGSGPRNPAEAGGVGTLDNAPAEPSASAAPELSPSAAPNAPPQAGQPNQGSQPGGQNGSGSGSGSGSTQPAQPQPEQQTVPPPPPPPPPPPQRAPGATEYYMPPNTLNAKYIDGTCVYGIFYGNYGSAAFAKVRLYNGACGGTTVTVASADGNGIQFLAVRGQEITGGTDECGPYYEAQATGGDPAYGIGMTVRFGETGHYLAFYFDQGAALIRYANC